MKNTGLIDLHDIDVLVNRYKAGERNLTVIPSFKENKPSVSLSSSDTLIKSNDEENNALPENNQNLNPEITPENNHQNLSQHNHLETSTNYQNLSQDNSQNLNVNFIDESQNIVIDKEIPLNKSEKINENNIEQKSPKITFDLARIILELHLEEIAENLVNPSDKALNPDLKPNFKMFKKE
ncbi:MAG: hypothetical protein GW795_03925 [Cyanobacteria bacterium]|nr:hypothetical protein [Cyanobacteria bacterium CG_2015-16_32_12]NCO78696.1 hypothetical protein [Cyanobacteria bacterium CG_2015-22_32_23]NCQ03278.1 hypothetical protein [Cyanobacteria bacterium CG_2015-09_32_10]NCQ41044.1 hypothetical protein [Cyanobacteria bacterium CG_2015-04_32_10]NCS85755.1 hypothetical protein [Cyanobacteria bacterium CG_2015-02_32_10]